MNAIPTRVIAAALFALVVAGALASCGKKEPLKPPPGSTYPRQYPPPPKPDVKQDTK